LTPGNLIGCAEIAEDSGVYGGMKVNIPDHHVTALHTIQVLAVSAKRKLVLLKHAITVT
jgi:hypothetical protein